MKRTDNLAENRLVTRLVAARKAFLALQSTAQTMGSTSVVLQQVTTGATSDFTVNATYNTINIWEITFTPNTTIANTGYVWHLFLTRVNIVGTGGFTAGGDQVSIANNVWTWRFAVIGTSPSASISFGIRITFYAMTQGTISVSQIQ